MQNFMANLTVVVDFRDTDFFFDHFFRGSDRKNSGSDFQPGRGARKRAAGAGQPEVVCGARPETPGPRPETPGPRPKVAI